MTVYDSLLDVPIDEHDPADDGDDRLVPSDHTPYAAPLHLPLGATDAERTMAVPFIPSGPGSKGKHVRALNRALSKAGFRKWQVFSLFWTPWVTKAVKAFQTSRHLPVTGKYDKATHEKLAPYYDQYAIHYLLLAPVPKPTKDQTERAGMLAQFMYLYNHRLAIGYTQARPGDCRTPPKGADCSFSGEWAGTHCAIGSPSGYSGCGYGNTQSQLARFRALSRVREALASALIGDPIYYGSASWNPTHVTWVVGRDPTGKVRVFSFGSYPAKILYSDYRHDRIAVCNLTGR